jgi:hypothetical protein
MPVLIDDMENELSSGRHANMQPIIGIFIGALNDWPVEILSIEDYLAQLELFIQTTATKETLEAALTTLNFKTEAWKVESITQLLELYLYYDAQLSVQAILEDVKSKINL